MSILDPTVVGEAFQYQLASIVAPIPVYAVFNRNFATEPQFVTWQMRNFHQPVFTGQTQTNLGINTPTFQITVFTQRIDQGFEISNLILQSLHGYSGQFGNNAFFVGKSDVVWLYDTYDNEENLAQVNLDCTLYLLT